MTLLCACAISMQVVCMRLRERERERERTSLNDAMALTTSLVNVFPTPEDPINTVGLIAWEIGTVRKMLWSSVTILIHNIREFSHLNSIQKSLDRFMLMCPRLLEVLKRLFTRVNNQSLQQTTAYVNNWKIIEGKIFKQNVNILPSHKDVRSHQDYLWVHKPNLLAGLFNRCFNLKKMFWIND